MCKKKLNVTHTTCLLGKKMQGIRHTQGKGNMLAATTAEASCYMILLLLTCCPGESKCHRIASTSPCSLCSSPGWDRRQDSSCHLPHEGACETGACPQSLCAHLMLLTLQGWIHSNSFIVKLSKNSFVLPTLYRWGDPCSDPKLGGGCLVPCSRWPESLWLCPSLQWDLNRVEVNLVLFPLTRAVPLHPPHERALCWSDPPSVSRRSRCSFTTSHPAQKRQEALPRKTHQWAMWVRLAGHKNNLSLVWRCTRVLNLPHGDGRGKTSTSSV